MPPPNRPPTSSPASNRSARVCPNCKKAVPAGSTRCPGCQLEVAKMAGFLAAMRAAEQRGMAKTKIEKERPIARPVSIERGEDKGPSPWPKIIALAILVAGIGWTIWHFTRPTPPIWPTLPTAREAVVRELFQHISDDTDPGYKRAYALISLEARDPSDSDELGHYIGLFHAIHKYLRDEIDPNWFSTATYTPDAKDENLYIVKIGLETLHVHVSEQTPADKLASDHEHYGVTGIDEFNIQDAATFQSKEVQMGVIRSVAGPAAERNLDTVIGASNFAHEPKMAKKIRLLPILRNPRETTWQTVIQTHPLRDDPVVRDRLTQIMNDDRYDPLIRQKAKNVLDDRVDAEDLIAVGVE